MFKFALFLLISIIAQPSIAQNTQSADGMEMQNRFLRFQHLFLLLPTAVECPHTAQCLRKTSNFRPTYWQPRSKKQTPKLTFFPT